MSRLDEALKNPGKAVAAARKSTEDLELLLGNSHDPM